MACFLLVIVMGVYCLCFTHFGLSTIFFLANTIIPGELQAQIQHDSQLNRMTLNNVLYHNDNIEVFIGTLKFKWLPENLFNKKIHINLLEIDSIKIKQIKKKGNQETSYQFNIRDYLDYLTYFYIDNVKITNVSYDNISHFHIKQLIFNDNKELNVSSDYGDITVVIDKKISLAWHLHIPKLQLLAPFMHGKLRSEGKITGTMRAPLIAATLEAHDLILPNGIKLATVSGKIQSSSIKNLLVTLSGKQVQYQKLKFPEFTSSTQMQFSRNAIHALSDIAVGKQNKIKVTTTLPAFDKLNDFEQPLSIFSDFEMKKIEQLLPTKQIREVRGNLTGSLKLTGSIGHPIISLAANLNNGQATIPTLYTNLTNIFLHANYNNNQPLHIQGTFNIGKGQGKLNGDIHFNDPTHFLTAQIQGESFTIKYLDEYLITLSPKLNIAFNQNVVDIKGKVNVSDALIAPRDLSQVVTMPKETEIVGAKTKSQFQSIPNLTLNIDLNLDKVKLIYQSLNILLTGPLSISQLPDKMPTGVGNLTITKGTYKIFGRVLKIKQGQILYAGNSLFNPGLNIKATQSLDRVSFSQDQTQFFAGNKGPAIYSGMDKLTVGAFVQGELNQPKVMFFSDPPGLSQMDIISYLTFSVPRSQITNANQLAFLNTALISTKENSGLPLSSLTKKIEDKLRLSEFSIGSTEIYDTTTHTSKQATTLNIGRKFGKNLSIHYKEGIMTSVSILSLQYKINKNFAIQTETSSFESAADLLYVIEFD